VVLFGANADKVGTNQRVCGQGQSVSAWLGPIVVHVIGTKQCNASTQLERGSQ
jgi:hypothetical protein